MGGGGGDTESAQREAERKEREKRERRDSAIRRLNAVFGTQTPGDVVNQSEGTFDAQKYLAANPDVAQAMADPRHSRHSWQTPYEHYVEYGKPAGWQAYWLPSATQQDRSTLNRNRTERERLYGNVERDTEAFHLDKHKRDYEDTLRELRFQLARGGQTGGSVHTDQLREAARLDAEGRARIGVLGDQARNRTRTADEESRRAAIRDINADVEESQVQAGLTRNLQQNLDQSIAAGKGEQLGNIFERLAYLYGQGKQGFDTARGVSDVRNQITASTLAGSSKPNYGS